MAIAGLALNAGAKLVFDPGDQIAVTTSNGFSVAGSSTVVLNGPVRTGEPLINYAGTLGKSRAISPRPAARRKTYTLRHTAATHTFDLLETKSASSAQIAKVGQNAPGAGVGGLFKASSRTS